MDTPRRASRVPGVHLLAAALTVVPSPSSARQAAPDAASLIRGRIEQLRSTGAAMAGGERLLALRALPAFYEARGFGPAWESGDRGARLAALRSAIGRAAAHGLDPSDYHLGALTALADRAANAPLAPEDVADLDLLASDAFMVLGSHLLVGRVNPESIDPEWLANRRSAALDEVLARALRSNRVEETLFGLAPQQPRYRRMLEAAERLRTIERRGGWTVVEEGPKLEVGSAGGRVTALRARLRASGDLPAGAGDGEVFDEALATAVRRFQSRHGLGADGVVGPATLAVLNVSAGARARQVEVNMERWRWLPEDLGERHIEVNIAGFEVEVVEGGHTVQVHRAVVGRYYRQTPMFSGVMTYLVLSPYWHVPPNIAVQDKLPVLKSDPGSLAAQRILLLDQRTNEAVDPATVDWGSVTGEEFNRRYRLRQDPGPLNALGGVKFMFPNPHNVYLHDTPSRELFNRASRGFSSGCIRIEHPLDLAEYLLADQPEWDRAHIERVASGGVERVVPLTRGVPVHLLYWTAWADEDGTMQFRDDVYGRDGRVERALRADPPGP